MHAEGLPRGGQGLLAAQVTSVEPSSKSVRGALSLLPRGGALARSVPYAGLDDQATSLAASQPPKKPKRWPCHDTPGRVGSTPQIMPP